VTFLLDLPWALDEVVNRASQPSEALRQFEDLCRDRGIVPAACLGPEEVSSFFTRLADAPGPGTWKARISSVVGRLMRDADETCQAEVASGPLDLRDSWKAALYEQLSELPDWRKPQVIVPESVRDRWSPGNFVTVERKSCYGRPASPPEDRVIAALESYMLHPFASSDFDPWDIRRTTPEGRYPCCLPKPPSCNGVSLKQLAEALQDARRSGWKVNGRYYYLPPQHWLPDEVPRHVWREGRAFPREFSPERNKLGYMDDEDRCWVWDSEERHWDVQLGGKDNYYRITHDGVPLFSKR
jgi:hypothetical protein